MLLFFFFFNDTATTEIYTLSLHDALPICAAGLVAVADPLKPSAAAAVRRLEEMGLETVMLTGDNRRSEEHTSELQSRQYLVCRLLLEKKKKLTYLPFYP